MRNRYLEILELQPGATEADVKAAYRRLSKIHHPDINRQEGAKEKFIEINEAYNFLLKVGPTPHNETQNYSYNPYTSEYDRWRKEAKAQARRKAQEQIQLKYQLIDEILSKFKYVAIAILAFNVLLTIDYTLPVKEHDQRIISKKISYEVGRGGARSPARYDIVEFEDFKMKFNRGEVKLANHYEKASVFATPILQVPIAVDIVVDGKSSTYEQVYNVYKVFGYLIPAIFILYGIYGYVIKNLDHKLTLALFIVFLTIVQLIYFFRS
jgi:hypothetical protein